MARLNESKGTMDGELDRLKRTFELRKVYRRRPQAIAGIVGELISQRGLARVRGQQQIEEVWKNVIGEPGARYTRVGAFRRGVLEILVGNSVLLQELAGFQAQSLLEKTRQALQSDQVRELRFRLDTCV